MNRRTISVILLGLGWFSIVPGAIAGEQAGEVQGSKQQEKKKSKQAESTLTGCVDEQDGQYILISDRTRSPIADLVADGFPTEGFAKHLGHTVTVRGISNPGGARPVFRVRGIQPVSDTCGPQHSAGN
jgi:hypothetical protein